MGFLASAMKRAYGIKDFATTLPGHGGFTDRFDCVTLYVIFSGIMLGTVIYRDDQLVADAEQIYQEELNDSQRAIIFRQLAETLGTAL